MLPKVYWNNKVFYDAISWRRYRRQHTTVTTIIVALIHPNPPVLSRQSSTVILDSDPTNSVLVDWLTPMSLDPLGGCLHMSNGTSTPSSHCDSALMELDGIRVVSLFGILGICLSKLTTIDTFI